MNNHKTVLIVVIVIIVLGAVAWFMLQQGGGVPEAPQGLVDEEAAEEESLGSQIFEQSQNPVAGGLDTPNPGDSVNPLEGVVTNPFE